MAISTYAAFWFLQNFMLCHNLKRNCFHNALNIRSMGQKIFFSKLKFPTHPKRFDERWCSYDRTWAMAGIFQDIFISWWPSQNVWVCSVCTFEQVVTTLLLRVLSCRVASFANSPKISSKLLPKKVENISRSLEIPFDLLPWCRMNTEHAVNYYEMLWENKNNKEIYFYYLLVYFCC